MKGESVKIIQMCNKLGLRLSVIVASMVLLLAAVPVALSDGPNENLADETVGPPPVSVPVVLDGVLYKSDEFNRIHSELYAKGIYIGSLFDSDNGSLIAFTSIEMFESYT